jgi:hypothetical protein
LKTATHSLLCVWISIYSSVSHKQSVSQKY